MKGDLVRVKIGGLLTKNLIPNYYVRRNLLSRFLEAIYSLSFCPKQGHWHIISSRLQNRQQHDRNLQSLIQLRQWDKEPKYDQFWKVDLSLPDLKTQGRSLHDSSLSAIHYFLFQVLSSFGRQEVVRLKLDNKVHHFDLFHQVSQQTTLSHE